ncbi:hypothetical protein AB6D11_19100 [Vibrio splendidus]
MNNTDPIRKIGEYFLKRDILKTHPHIICPECGELPTLIRHYHAVSTEINIEEAELVKLHFEEREVSECCLSPVELHSDNENEIPAEQAYNYNDLGMSRKINL